MPKTSWPLLKIHPLSLGRRQGDRMMKWREFITLLGGANVQEFLLTLRDLVRWQEWHYSKTPLFFVGMVYAILRMPQPGATQAVQMAALLVLLCFYAAFGHIVNDYADRDIDRAAGKKKLLAAWSERGAQIAAAIPFIGTIGLALICFDSPTTVVTMIAVLVAALYSLPPARLKERGALGWLAAALAQRTLPLAIICEALKVWDVVLVGFSVLSTLIGLRWIIAHQLQDRENDRGSGVRTLATEQDPQHLVALLHVLFSLECTCACAVVATMSYFVSPALGVAAFAYAVGRSGKPFSAAEFDKFYCVVWPITLAVLLALRDPVFLPMLFVAITFERDLRMKFHAAYAGFIIALKAIIPRQLFPSLFQYPSGALAAAESSVRKPQIDKADPYPVYAQLRGMGPVLKLDWAGIGPTWVVLRYREAISVLTDSRFLRNADLSAASGAQNLQPDRVGGLRTHPVELESPHDPRLGQLVGKAFTPRILQRLTGRIEQIASQILHRGKSRGEIELMSEYASVIPFTTIPELLGLPIGDFTRFHAFIYSLAVHHMLDRHSNELEAARSQFTKELHTLFAARRATPQDDLLTSLLQLEQDGRPLSDKELSAIVYSLLLGGVTTTNIIGNGMLALLRHPEQLELLRQNPSIADTAIEELLRFDSAFELSDICCPSAQVELGGVPIPGGAPIRVLIPSANRDERQFPSPDTLDFTRYPCLQLSFQGIQHRLAAPLVRLETKIAIKMLIDAAPNLRFGDPLQMKWVPHPILRRLQHLPLRL
jgi:cytochrome P450/4-hydroxybenzoate polyprenyltransferase